MAKKNLGISFTNAVISKDESGKLLITETVKVKKDEFRYDIYDLVQELLEYENIEGITLTVGLKEDKKPLESKDEI